MAIKIKLKRAIINGDAYYINCECVSLCDNNAKITITKIDQKEPLEAWAYVLVALSVIPFIWVVVYLIGWMSQQYEVIWANQALMLFVICITLGRGLSASNSWVNTMEERKENDG